MDELHALAAFFDTDEAIVIRMRHEPHDAAARLLVALGCGWIVDPDAEPCAIRCGREECIAVPVVTIEEDWIGYRASVACAARRADRGDETLEICGYCECEVDVETPIHSPKCKSPQQVGVREGRAPALLVGKERKPRLQPDGAELLRQMDAGERIPRAKAAVDDDEPELLEGTLADGLDDEVDEEPELEEAAAAPLGGVDAASSSAKKVGPAEQHVLDLIRAGKTRVKEIAEGRGVSDATVSQNLLTLVRKGHVVRVARGVYGLAGTTPAVPEREPETDGHALEAAAPPTPRATPSASAKQPAAATPSRSDTTGWIKVDGTGLAYRNPDEAYLAAIEIEADGERVATACREDGNDERADQAVDQAHELAQKIRMAARAAEERASGSSTSSVAAKPEAEPQPEADPEVEVEPELPPAAVVPEVREAAPGTVAIPTPLTRLLAKIPAAELEQAIDEYDSAIAQLQKELALVELARTTQEAA